VYHSVANMSPEMCDVSQIAYHGFYNAVIGYEHEWEADIQLVAIGREQYILFACRDLIVRKNRIYLVWKNTGEGLTHW